MTTGRLTAAGVRRAHAVDLPPEAEAHRAEVRVFPQGFDDLPPREQRRQLVDEGYLNPHWPRPWGRGAGAVEQLAIVEELAAAGVERPEMGIGGWVTLTFTQHGTEDQVRRWTRPSLLGETRWCQLFSEPNAGSDAAGVQTRATKVEGGWVVNGQKLWTSGAHECTHGFATVRKEDRRLLTGHGRYVDDLTLPGQLHLAFLRSDVAKARITGIETSAAEALPGVVRIFTAATLNPLHGEAWHGMLGEGLPTPPPLAKSVVRHPGDPIACVVATSRYVAEDACELIEVDLEIDRPVVDYRVAGDDPEHLVHGDRGASSNVMVDRPFTTTADLCLLHVPLAAALRAPDRDHVRCTIRHGMVVTPWDRFRDLL